MGHRGVVTHTRERCALGLSRGTSPPSSVGVKMTSPEFDGGLLLFPQTDTASRCAVDQLVVEHQDLPKGHDYVGQLVVEHQDLPMVAVV